MTTYICSAMASMPSRARSPPAACRASACPSAAGAEAAWAAERLADAKIAAIYASPLQRAQETAHVSATGSACRSTFATI